MAKMRQVNTFFWDDSYIENLKPNAKLLFIYLITSPQTNIAGSFEISLKKICDHSGLSRSKVEEILVVFEKDEKFFYRDNWMLAANAIEHQDTGNEKIRKGIEIIISASPGWVMDRVCIGYSWLSHLKNRLSHPNPNPNSNPKPNGGNDSTVFVAEVLIGVQKEFGLKKLSLSDQRDWSNHATLAFENEFTSADFLECLALLRKQDWRNSEVDAKTVTKNLSGLRKLRAEGNRNGETKLQSAAEKLAADEEYRKNAPRVKPPVRGVQIAGPDNSKTVSGDRQA